MNKLEYYSRQKDSWGEEELSQLKEEYETKEMTVSEIADIHRRTPGSISYKLKNLGIIVHNILSRGYSEYKSSELYKEIVQKGIVADAERAEKKLNKEVKPVVVKKPNTEILQLQKDVKEIKENVSKILELMNALYEFESNQA
jgi:DNA-binding transcriptional regulator GbsR (MarR family)